MELVSSILETVFAPSSGMMMKADSVSDVGN
jgi:hypothetical protein